MIEMDENFIDETHMEDLISTIDRQKWCAELKRRVQHYGYRYDYDKRKIDHESYIGKLPNFLKEVALLIVGFKNLPTLPNQVIVNEYLPGQGIAPHTDCVPCFGPVIASLSLGSACTMLLSNPDTGERVDLRLAPCSLLVLSGEERYRWRHGIPARKSDMVDGVRVPRSRRVSLTFRTVLTS